VIDGFGGAGAGVSVTAVVVAGVAVTAVVVAGVAVTAVVVAGVSVTAVVVAGEVAATADEAPADADGSSVVVAISLFDSWGLSATGEAKVLGSAAELGDVPLARVLIPKRSPNRVLSLLLLLFSKSSAGFETLPSSCTRRSASILSCGLASSIRRGFRISQKPLRRRDERLFWLASASPSSGGGSWLGASGDSALLLELSAPGRRSIRLFAVSSWTKNLQQGLLTTTGRCRKH
jgi:hypothetical protein